MNISIKEIKESLPISKTKADPFWTNFVLRPLSFPFAWLFIRIGWTANYVTYLSIFIAILGGILLLSSDSLLVILGTILFNVFAVLDCADGNIARATKKYSIYGGWVDALGGYIAYTSVLIFTGISIKYNQGNTVFEIDYVLVASCAAISNLLMRVIYQNFKSINSENIKEELSSKRSISQNFGITGFMMPFLLLCAIFNILEIFILFYVVYFALISMAVILKLVIKVERSGK